MRGARGFSLIELLITTAIFAVLSVIAILYAPGIMDAFKVRGAARLIYSDMQMARLSAIKEGKQWALEFTGNTYCVKNQGAVQGWTAGCATADDEIVKTVNLDSDYSGVSITVKPIRDIFYPDGRACFEPASGDTVTISKGERTQSLCIRSGTGHIRIVDGANC